MALRDSEYRILEDIVGTENITSEPAILDTYNQVWGNKALFDQKFSQRPAAVLLPGSTEEVQAVVTACNEHRIAFKPFSSGFEFVSLTLANERGILLDLKRMDRVLEIDAENMCAVVEPYVGIYRLQKELARHGLTIGAVGCGPNANVIAASCCHFGGGLTAVSTGGLGRSVLGVEWVLPTGEIVRLGAPGTGVGWFTGDGPGPSLRGVLRGRSGANGGHGVITKAAVKCYPWYGGEWKFQGQPGTVTSAKRVPVPANYENFVLTFPSPDDLWEAMARVGRAEIAACVMGAFLFPQEEGNDEQWAEIQKLQQIGFNWAEVSTRSVAIVLGSETARGMEYRKNCLMHICREMGGASIPLAPEQASALFAGGVFHFGFLTEAIRRTGDFFVNPTHDATVDMVKIARKSTIELIQPYMDKGLVQQTGAVDLYATATEHNSIGCHVENITFYDPWDPDSLQALREIAERGEDPHGSLGAFGVPQLGGGLQIEFVNHLHQKWGPVYDNYDASLRKIKQALDPNNVGDWSAYVPPIFP
ncbi:MAG: FAD-binding oxidoreductase [Deltaproteobacteria bacterium]|nr:FAD-binding oxidoreductase [Deltaproteobacteria bacterium]